MKALIKRLIDRVLPPEPEPFKFPAHIEQHPLNMKLLRVHMAQAEPETQLPR